MPHISYVCPAATVPGNSPPRGSLSRRWEEAQACGCSYASVPAGFISTPDEEEATGLPMHAMLTPSAVRMLYEEESSLPDDCRYVLETDRSFPHTDRNGRRHAAAQLRWDDRVWVTEFVQMLVYISDQLGRPADIIRIHPGKAHGVTYSAIARSMRFIRDYYADACGVLPSVVIENAVPSLLETGTDIRQFWQTMQEQAPGICDTCGVLLNMGALATAAKRRSDPVESHLAQLPAHALQGFAVAPSASTPDDPIPWGLLFGGIAILPHDACIYPDTGAGDGVADIIAFCRERLAPPSSAFP
ncbi:hypothetical protein AZH53_00875 [Methanomicrobiaceae archaeon CYW5]|uniref:hypothetical protein n=1 Tax=Methanovulcanius yangii TaxID=1789227 RepID=UPI0029CA2983|nr:hypothetical protein [Methanovulcanius yangii]MBT8506981.1 hypothetical protein [Methanovulcanius yangii]